MFRKPRRANRVQRKGGSDDEQEDSTAETPQLSDDKPPATVQASASKKTLSFGDDLEEIDSFKVKRPAHSRRVLKQLKEGKSSLKPLDGDKSASRNDALLDKSATYPSELNESMDPSYHEEEEIIKVKPLSRSSSEQFSSMLKQGVIPDASTIHMVRKQRQQAKFQLEAEEENASPPHSGTDNRRLIREEDEDEEEEDYEGSGGVGIYQQRRPAFTLTAEYRDPASRRRVDISRGLRRRQELETRQSGSGGGDDAGTRERRSLVDAAETETASTRSGGEDEDEDEDNWERQQIQKAVSSRNTAVMEALEPTPPASDGLLPKPQRRLADLGDVTLASVKAILQERFERKQKAYREDKRQLEEARADLEAGKATIAESRARLPLLAETLAFYLQLREYVRDVIACFNEKTPKIDYMDKRTIILYRERADTLMARRRADVNDMADEAAGTSVTADISVDLKVVEARKRRKADREARRIRRRRLKKPDADYDKRIEKTIGVSPPCDGVSSDDEESQAAVAKRASDFGDLKKDAERLFDDVEEEYCTISAILRRFAEWRDKNAGSYAQAFIPMCLPHLLAPLIRLQMIAWNPLEPDCPFFDHYTWFGDLLDYFGGLKGMEDLENDDSKQADEERKALISLSTSPDHEVSVIPLVIEKVVLPRLTEIVSAAWDPLSWSQTKRLVSVVRSMVSLWPTVCAESKATQRLFEAVLQRMEQTIQADVFIPLYSKQVMSDPQSLARLFFDRQMNTAMKLFSNLLEWHDLLAPAALQHLALTCLLNRYLLIGLASLMSTTTGSGGGDEVDEAAAATWAAVAERLRAVVVNLPPDWLAAAPADESQLAQVRRFVAQLIERLAPLETAKDDSKLRALVKKLKRIHALLFGKSSAN